MDRQFCPTYEMSLSYVNKGTNVDGSQNNDYCMYCYNEGRFTQNFTMSRMIDSVFSLLIK